PQPVAQLTNARIHRRRLAGRKHQQPAARALGQRLLRDQLRRQFVVEVGLLHRGIVGRRPFAGPPPSLPPQAGGGATGHPRPQIRLDFPTPPQPAPLARRGPAPTARHPLLPPLAGRPGGGACAAPTIFVREPAPPPPPPPPPGLPPPPPAAGGGGGPPPRRPPPPPAGRGGGGRGAPAARARAPPPPPPRGGGAGGGARTAPTSFATEPAPTPPLASQAVPPSPAGGGGAVVSFACGEGRLPFELGGEDHRGGGALHAVDRANAVGELVHVTHGRHHAHGHQVVRAAHRMQAAHLRHRVQRLDHRRHLLGQHGNQDVGADVVALDVLV